MMDYQKYKGHVQSQPQSKVEYDLERFERLGFFICSNVLSADVLGPISEKMDIIWEKQRIEYGDELLERTGDYGQIRGMMLYDAFFYELILHPIIQTYVSAILSDTAILHLQNGIVTFPERRHNQGKFHKDFAKSFRSSKPLSLNAFVVIDEFSEQTGGTWLVPGSHLFENMPSDQFIEEHKVQLIAKPGSILFFDSTLWHAGGVNLSKTRRRAINHQFTLPFIKQQLDYPAILKGTIELESKLAQVMGLWTIPPKSIAEYRVSDPSLRTYRAGQG